MCAKRRRFDPKRPIRKNEPYSPGSVRHLNNLHLRFPNHENIPSYREHVLDLGEWDSLISSPPHYANSALTITQTNAKFYFTLDQVVVRLGIDPRVLKNTNRKMFSGKNKASQRAFERKRFSLFWPIYYELRKTGYNWNDLCR